MRVLIFEPDHTGHHFAYLHALLPAVARAVVPDGKVIVATTPAAMGSSPYQMLLRPVAEFDDELSRRILVDGTLPPAKNGTGLGAAMARAGHLKAAIARHEVDHVILPYADGLAQAISLRSWTLRRTIPRGVSSHGLFLRGAIAYPAAGAKRRMSTKLSWMLAEEAPIGRIQHLDPVVYDWLLARDPRASERWSVMPDPVDQPSAIEKIEARKRLGLPLEGRAICCAGMIDRRKGCDLLVKAFAAAKLEAADRLYLFGPHEAEVRELIQANFGPKVTRVVSWDRFVAPADIAVAMQAADLICTPYPGHIGSASIVIRAAAAGRPVLAADFGWMQRTVPRFGLGWTCDVTNPESFAAELGRAVGEAGAWKLGEAGKRWLAFHHPENFAAHWCVPIAEAMGKPAPEVVSWESVTEAAR